MATIAGSIEAMAAYARRNPGAHPRQWIVRFRPDRMRDPPSFGTERDALAPRHTLHYGWEPHWYTVTIDDHVWSPRAYVDLARRRVEGLSRSQQPSPSVSDEDFLTTLTDLRVSVLQEENKRLSNALERDILDPQLHEQAALLLGALGLREAANVLTDERYVLSRMAAHLSFASALHEDEGLGLAGRVAENVVLTLVRREKDAVEALRTLVHQPSSAPLGGVEAWSRALMLRNTGDWRRNRGRGARRLEQLEEFRALRYRHSTEAAQRYLDEASAGPDTMWHRVALREDRSVADCARFAGSAVSSEIEEMKTAWDGLGEPNLSNDGVLVAALNEQPALGGVCRTPDRLRVQVIDRGLWAIYLQRHLLGAVLGENECYEHLWGATEEAAGYTNEARERFSQLRLFPFIAPRMTQDLKTSAQALSMAAETLRTAPELATAQVWVGIREKGRKLARHVPAPDMGLWFSPPFPRNTVYDSSGRLHELDAIKVPSLEQHAAWRAMAPYDAFVNWSYLWQRRMGHGPADEMMRGSALFLDYDTWMLRQVVDAAVVRAGTEPDTYKDAARRLCELDPTYWRTFAFQLAWRGDAEEAAEAFRTMVQRSPDTVSASNSLHWLVLYDLEQGRREEARRMAEWASEVFSAGGLATMGIFLEKIGQYDRALDYFRMIVERYESRYDLVAFYLRNQDHFKGTPIQRQLRLVVDEVFPNGLETVRPEDTNGPPQHGLLVYGNPWDVRNAGLLVGDVIVGVNGKRARTWEQYRVILNLDPPSRFSRKMKLVFWRNDRYVEQEIYPSDAFSIKPYP